MTPIEDIEIANNIYMFRRYEKQMIAFQTDRRLSEHAPAGHNNPEDKPLLTDLYKERIASFDTNTARIKHCDNRNFLDM